MSNAVSQKTIPLLTGPRFTPKGLIHSLLRLPIALLDLMIDWQQHAEERAMMTRLSDHQRRDIGLTGEQLTAMAQKARWSR